MRVASVTVVTTVIFGLLATLAAPVAVGDHCETRLAVYGRSAFSPQPASPYSKTTAGSCPRNVQDTPVGGHTLPPNSDQVFVRINGDFGTSIQTVRIELTGLGFDRSSFVLNRTENDLGGFTYQTREWLFMPAPLAGGDVVATAFYPSGPVSTTVHSSPISLPLPQAPPVSVVLDTIKDVTSTPFP